MAWTPIGVGSAENDGLGDKIRLSFQKTNLIVSTMWDTITGGLKYALGIVHIQDGAAGGSSTSFSRLIVESSDATANDLTILSKNTAQARLLFGDEDDNDVGAIKYFHSSDSMGFVINANTTMTLKSTGVVNLVLTPVYANNAAALVGGLVAGDVYKTASTGDATLMVTNAT